MSLRRFSPPWTIKDIRTAFRVEDAHGQALAYVYYEEEETRRGAANMLCRDEARRIAVNIAKLPTLLGSG